MKLTIIRHIDRVWRYRWDLSDSRFHQYGFSITVWGARWAARKAVKEYRRPKKLNVGETVFEEEL